jgi:hypothetical protein
LFFRFADKRIKLYATYKDSRPKRRRVSEAKTWRRKR